MKTKIQKWGNSLAVRLPKSITQEQALEAGLGVNVLVKDGQIVIEPLAEEITLESLLSTIKSGHIHGETDWGETKGNEIW